MDLAIYNPWWEQAEAIERDQHLQVVGSPYYLRRPELERLGRCDGSIFIIRGPRQVGKTTLLKEVIDRELREGAFAPGDVLYLSCETVPGYEQLFEPLREWLSERSGSSLVLLDEISFVPEWQRAILALANLGLLQAATVILTGSNARDLKASAERLPGRRGSGVDIAMRPLTPLQYLELPCFAGAEEQQLLDIYLQVGGFPHAIRDYSETGFVSDVTYTTYKNWIVGDAARYGLSNEFLEHILFRIAQTTSSRVTWSSLIETTPVRSHQTGASYVEHLQDAFLGEVLYALDPERELPLPNKARKVYLIDPLLFHLAHAWRRGLANVWSLVERHTSDPTVLGPLFELVAVTSAPFPSDRKAYWYSAKLKKEVDLLVRAGSDLCLYDCALSGKPPSTALGRPVSIVSRDNAFDFFRSGLVCSDHPHREA